MKHFYRIIIGILILSLSTLTCLTESAVAHPHQRAQVDAHANDASHNHVNKTFVDTAEHCADCFQSTAMLLPCNQEKGAGQRVFNTIPAFVTTVSLQTKIAESLPSPFHAREGPLFEGAVSHSRTLVLRT